VRRLGAVRGPGELNQAGAGVAIPAAAAEQDEGTLRTAQNFFGDNIYFDISGTVTLVAGSPIQDEFVWTMRNVGIDNLLLGSDFPQFSLPQTLAAFDKLGLTEEEKAKIRYGNAQRLFGLK